MVLNLRKSDLLFPKGISVVEKYGAKVEEKTLKGIYVKKVCMLKGINVKKAHTMIQGLDMIKRYR